MEDATKPKMDQPVTPVTAVRMAEFQDPGVQVMALALAIPPPYLGRLAGACDPVMREAAARLVEEMVVEEMLQLHEPEKVGDVDGEAMDELAGLVGLLRAGEEADVRRLAEAAMGVEVQELLDVLRFLAAPPSPAEVH